MKAIEWQFINPQRSNNFKTNIVFGKKFSQYKAFINVFIFKNDRLHEDVWTTILKGKKKGILFFS